MMSEGEMTWTNGLVQMIEPEVVTEIISKIADLALVISSSGVVLAVLSNPTSRLKNLFSTWEGQPLTAHLSRESVPKFKERLAAFLEDGNSSVRPIELNHVSQEENEDVPVRYSFHQTGKDGALLMLGQDLQPVAEMQQQLVAAQLALEKDYELQRECDTRLRVLMSATSEGTLFLSASTGEITECNPAAMALLGLGRPDLMGRFLPDLVSLSDGGKLLETLHRSAGAQVVNDLIIKTNCGRELGVRATMFRAAGEQALLCQITDKQSGAMRSDGIDEYLAGLFERGADGIVFINKAGSLLSANDAFMRMTDVVHAQAIKGRSITEFLGRGSVDLNVICENATRSGTMRLYATRLIGEHDVEIPVEIATTLLSAAQDPVFALVIRDASRAEVVRKSSQQITDVDMRSVIELIGSQTLKGIVAKTTDVIEKMCIETAVELTSNNRVAAAEMLGLSRQSLYVKLRKYDLLKKETKG